MLPEDMKAEADEDEKDSAGNQYSDAPKDFSQIADKS